MWCKYQTDANWLTECSGDLIVIELLLAIAVAVDAAAAATTNMYNVRFNAVTEAYSNLTLDSSVE